MRNPALSRLVLTPLELFALWLIPPSFSPSISHYAFIQRASNLPKESNLYFFRNQLKPMWEVGDPKHGVVECLLLLLL